MIEAVFQEAEGDEQLEAMMRHHPESCVNGSLPKESYLRGYYRHKTFLWNKSIISQKGECYACPQEKAYHIGP